MKPWTFGTEELLEIPSGYDSFVYLMVHESSGKSYIGKKQFHFSRLKVLKGKRKRIKSESDWKTYHSSSLEIQALVASGESFKREILYLCKSKGMANYLEAREQFDRRVLENQDKYFNKQIRARVHFSHVKLNS